MGFSLFHALGGAAKQYTKGVEREREQEMSMFTSELEALANSASERIKERTTTKRELAKIGKALVAQGLDEAKAVGILDMGAEEAKAFLKKAPAYVEAIRTSPTNPRSNFTINDLVTLADPETTGAMSLQEGVDNIMGIYVPDETKTDSAFAFSERADTRAMQQSALKNLSAITGMSPEELRATSAGDFEYGDTPSVAFSSEYNLLGGAEVRKALAEARRLEGQATITEAEAGVAGQLAGLKVNEAEMRLDVLDEQLTEKRAQNADWATRKKQRDEKFQMDMTNANATLTGKDLDNAEKRIRNEYAEKNIKTTIQLRQKQIDKELEKGETVADKLKVKDYLNDFQEAFTFSMKGTEVGKNLRWVNTPNGFSLEWIGSDESRATYQQELDNFSTEFLRQNWMSVGPDQDSIAAVKLINPNLNIEAAADSATMRDNPFTPYRFKQGGVEKVGYYNDTDNKFVLVKGLQ